MDIKQAKQKIRQNIKRLRAELPKEEKKWLDTLIFEQFVATMCYKRADILLIYISTDTENDTIQIIKHAFEDKKVVALPYCNTKNCTITFYQITSFADLKQGYYNILAPDITRCIPVNFAEYHCAVCVVPALCFDYNGFRIGYGKGYYDRFLSTFHGVTVGLTYSFYLQKYLPHGKFDKAVMTIITEKGVRAIEKQ